MSREYSKAIGACPGCGRSISVNAGRYSRHNSGEQGDICDFSQMRAPYRADQQTPTDWVGRAHIVANLAADVQDSDPAVVWQWLTALPADELQRLMMIALAAVPVEQTVAEMFAWVTELPAAETPATPKENAA